MKFFKLILFLLVTNTILGQSYWSFKSRPAVPIYGPAVNFNDTISSSIASTNKVVTSPRRAKAQSVAPSKCIDNLDFEKGNFTNWKCYVGTARTNGINNYVTWNPTYAVAPVAGRHQIISASSLPVNDPYGNFPRLCPWGGNYSLQLGSTATNKLAEKVSCSFTIPADQNNFVIEYFYAVVFQDPKHPFDEQPRFQAKVYDANNSSNIITCASYDFTAASGLPGFEESVMDSSVLYKPWSAVTINLSGYAGHTVILEFSAEDCTLGGHFGYAYVDVNSTCTSLTKSLAYCKNTSSITLDAPSGYEEYNWYDSSYTKLLGTGQTLTLSPPPSSSQVINVDLVPYSGFGCRDTAYTALNVNPVPAVSFKSDTAVCVGKPVSFTNTSTIDDSTIMTYFWDFGDGTSSSTANNTKIFNAVGNYKVKLVATSINGCTDSIVKTISVGSLATIAPITGQNKICAGQTAVLQNTTTGGIWKSTKPAVATISNTGVVSALSAGVDTIRYIVSNLYGCADSVSYALNVIANTASTTNASICPGGVYTFNGTSYNSAGTYVKHFVNVAGCDSTATLNLVIKQPSSSTTNVSICSTEFPYVWNGVSYSNGGTYTKTLVNAVGCDSVATLTLTKRMTTSSITTASVCSSDLPYVWNGTNYSASSIYMKSFVNAAGCDSVAILMLLVRNSSTSTSSLSICKADLPYVWNGISCSIGGTYTKRLINAVGCDSTATLNLTVKLPSSSTVSASVCVADLPYVWNGTNYTATGIYSKHFMNAVGCDSTATLNLTVKLPSSSTVSASVCVADLPYVWNGTNYTATGTYSKHFLNAVGCDSIATLNLTVKLPSNSTVFASVCAADLPYVWNGTNYTASGTYSKHFSNVVGCDSTATLDLTVKLPSSSTFAASVCVADLPYVWNGTNYTATGTYSKHFLNAVGCDSIATLNLTVKLPSSSTVSASVCAADLPYVWNGTNYTATGTYSKHFLNAVGCDSIATLDLIVKLPISSTVAAFVCVADLPYVWNGTNYTASGTYSKHFLNAVGCDSIATLDLTVKLPSSSTVSASVCTADLPYVWNGTNYTATGTYSKHFLNTVGCDSTATLNLTVKLPSSSTVSASVCVADLPYMWNGTNYTATGTYSKHFLNAMGCDSTATLDLTVKLPSSSTVSASVCVADLPYVWNGTNYTASGTYIKHFLNAVGCDSTATLNLTVKLPSNSTVFASVCAADLPYVWNGTNYTASGTYSKHFSNVVGCDSTATLDLTVKLPSSSTFAASVCVADLPYVWNGTNYTATGTYSKHFLNAVGCDSIATLDLTVKLPSSFTVTASVCVADLPYMWNGTNYIATGTYSKHFINAAGCDSTATLNLNVKLPSSSTISASVCVADLPYVWNGTNYTATGTYSKYFMNAVGCDSTATLNLTVKLPSSSTVSVSVCSADLPYVWNGMNYTATGTYSKHFLNVVGCDSTATLNLTVKLPSSSTVTASICTADLPYVWNGTNYTATGIYSKHFMNAVGCDSTATLNLTVKLPSSSTVSASVCVADLPYVWNGTNYTATGTYSKHFLNAMGCDSTATLNLTVKLPSSSTVSASVCTADLPYVWNGTNYTASGTYSKHFLNAVGCDSTATLDLTVKLPSSSTVSASVCVADLPYVWNGTNYTASGTYSKHFLNAVGCDSTATLNLTVKLPSSSTVSASVCAADLPYVWNGTNYTATGIYNKHFMNAVGCDSTATLNLTVKLPSSSTVSASVCVADLPYVWNGTNYTASGTYSKHFLNAAGCDSTATLDLTVKLPSSSTVFASVCTADLPYVWNGTNYTATGTYSKHFLNTVGCDSTATLNLTVKLPSSSTVSASVCAADLPYVWNGTNYTASGTYSKHFLNAVGCDSTATLNLTVKLPSSSTVSASVCAADLPYAWNGTNYTASGTYSKHFLNTVGCDSTATLNLTVKLPSSSTVTASVCTADLPYVWNGTNYTATGTYSKHFMNAVGCDSTVTLNLTVKLPSTSTVAASVCTADLPYVWNGANYTATGTYSKHFMNAVGCDSTATLNLTVKLPSSSVTNTSVCQGDSYLFNGVSYAVAGTYVVHLVNAAGCDSVATLNLSVKLPTASTTNVSICQGDSYSFNGTSYTAAGAYVKHLLNVAGCDSVATLNLTLKLPTTSFSSKTICEQDLPIVWNGLSCTAAGTYNAKLINAVGCDSVATLKLTVNKTASSTIEMTTCPSALPFVWNGISYAAAGNYAIRLTSANGCDSIANLVLHVKTPLTSTTTEYVCSSLLPYVWNKKLYFDSGTYMAQFVSAAGCDSIATLELTVVFPSSSVSKESVSSLELPYVWNKLALTETGTYTAPDKYLNSMGCDSIAKLILKVNLSTSAVTNASVCASDLPYIWNATPYYGAGTFTKTMTNVLGQDVKVTLNLSVIYPQTSTQKIQIFSGESYTINGHAYDKPGVYADNLKNENGCDSTVVTELSFVNVPNTITPNGDGYNDTFMKGWRVQVYNRNGIMLYDGDSGWDGNYNNKPVSKDTYFYVLFYPTETGMKTKEGYLMVIR